jgi:hypothetical protein
VINKQQKEINKIKLEILKEFYPTQNSLLKKTKNDSELFKMYESKNNLTNKNIEIIFRQIENHFKYYLFPISKRE